MPDLEPHSAADLLAEAGTHNPGPWISHSRHAADAARRIATSLRGVEPERAYALGLVHDIGRRFGVTDMRHVLDGYHFLLELGYPAAARICLTHSYPIKVAASGSGRWDGTQEELDFVQKFLDAIEYHTYDRLIQLCDAVSLPSGFCLMEKRFVDVSLRHGFNDYTLPKWRAFLKIKADFEERLGHSIYDLLPGVIENTFTREQYSADV